MFAVLLLFGVTGIAIYVPPIPLWLDPYLIDVYVVLLAVGLGSALRAIVRAEGLQVPLSKQIDRVFILAPVGREFIGHQLVRGWRTLLRKKSTGLEHTRLAVRLLLLSVSIAVVVVGWKVGGLSWVGLSYVLAFTLAVFILALSFIGWLKTRGGSVSRREDGYSRWASRRSWL